MRALGLLLAAALLPGAAAAQQIQGWVVDAQSEAPIPGATVELLDSGAVVLRRAIADTTGAFWLWHDRPGPIWISVQRIGYAPVVRQPVRLDSATVVELEVRMRPEAVAVEPIRVLARREIRRGTPEEFYDRLDRLGDRAAFVTRDDIEASSARLPSLAAYAAPGTWLVPRERSGYTLLVRGSRGLCQPDFYLNGMPLPRGVALDDMVGVDQIEGIEVYRGHFTPDWYAPSPQAWGCGMVLVWTRRDVDPRYVPTWGRLALFSLLGGLAYALSLAF